MTTYQSFITGTKRDANDEGPEELHILLLDNGRSRMLAHPVTRQSLACIRCGACLNACPVYQQVGGHAYGSVYPGPIGAVITPQLMGIAKAAQLPYASSLCGACREVCPVKIDIPRLLLHCVERFRSARAVPASAWRSVVGESDDEPGVVQDECGCRPFASASRSDFASWTSGRDLRPVERRSFHELWSDE